MKEWHGDFYTFRCTFALRLHHLVRFVRFVSGELEEVIKSWQPHKRGGRRFESSTAH